ncbi:hypothetical protein ACFP1Z_02905 [Streptomyces gamaensis]|uniref:Uncharacterized protein n=1 Tax=Streptomyces gamaensis TaxID=1763542 RepID=A0ABW0YWH6_9ACTN
MTQTTTRQRQTTHAELLRRAEAAVTELDGALRHAGITLPSLRVETSSYCAPAVVLVDLGRCNTETAEKLATAIRTALPEAREHGGRP